MLDSSDFMPLGKAEEWSLDTATCHLSGCVVEGKSLLKKSLHSQFLMDEKLRTCLRKEYETGKLLSAETPYVVRYYQLIDTQAECAILMDFVDGLTLDAFILAQPLYFSDEARLDAFMRQLLDALKVIHHAQVVHLDIKPTNLLLTSVNSDLRIIDFGLSYISTYPHTSGLTVNFAAPEQTDGTGEVDCRTDIYAVGKILEYIQNNQGDNVKTNADSLDGQKEEAHRHLLKKWQFVMEKCLMPRKEDRWQNIEAILSFWDNENQIAEERLQRKGLLGKTIFAVAVALLVVVGISAWCVSRKREVTFADEYGNLYQVKSEDSLTCRLMGRGDTCTNVNLYIEPHISYDGKRYRVVEIADYAFLGDQRLQTLCLPHTLRRIGSRAFRECKQLLVADIPDEVTNMDNMAFWGCSKLSEVHISKGLTRIPSSCFSKTGLMKVVVPEGVRSIGYDAFGVCEQLKSVTLPQSLKSIERGVFWRCSSLDSIRIPKNVHEIGQFCLMECNSLKDVYDEAQEPQRVVKLFGKATASHVTLHVPAMSVEAYKKAECWSEVKCIVPTPGK